MTSKYTKLNGTINGTMNGEPINYASSLATHGFHETGNQVEDGQLEWTARIVTNTDQLNGVTIEIAGTANQEDAQAIAALNGKTVTITALRTDNDTNEATALI